VDSCASKSTSTWSSSQLSVSVWSAAACSCGLEIVQSISPAECDPVWFCVGRPHAFKKSETATVSSAASVAPRDRARGRTVRAIQRLMDRRRAVDSRHRKCPRPRAGQQDVASTSPDRRWGAAIAAHEARFGPTPLPFARSGVVAPGNGSSRNRGSTASLHLLNLAFTTWSLNFVASPRSRTALQPDELLRVDAAQPYRVRALAPADRQSVGGAKSGAIAAGLFPYESQPHADGTSNGRRIVGASGLIAIGPPA